MADLLPNHQRTGIEMAAWAAKIVFLVIGIASSAVLLAKLAVPSSLPRLWNSVLAWLAPPYLFITVHFIIIVIWQLHGNQRPDEEKSPDDGDAPLPIKSTDLATSSPPDSLGRKPSSEICHEISPSPTVSCQNPAAESCLTTDSDEKSPVSPRVEIKKSIAPRPWPPPEREEDESSLASAAGHDSMDATWKAIVDGGSLPARATAAGRELRKSETFTEAARSEAAAVGKEMRKSETFREVDRAEAAGWRTREVLVVGNDELFRRVEAFIKMNYDQMRLQGQDSEQRFVEMVNAAY